MPRLLIFVQKKINRRSLKATEDYITKINEGLWKHFFQSPSLLKKAYQKQHSCEHFLRLCGCFHPQIT